MKKTIILVLPIFLLLLNSFRISAAKLANPVRDIHGKVLTGDVAYYILPVRRGSGGGVTMGNPVNASGSCPRSVVQDPSELKSGDNVTFTPVDPKEGVIRVSTDLNIKFKADSPCAESSVWMLFFEDRLNRNFIGLDGEIGNPGITTSGNWFKIEEYDTKKNWYNLRFCPTVCDCKPVCQNVGIYIDRDGSRHLALTTGKPFVVFFKEA